jgi:hypothetical protein
MPMIPEDDDREVDRALETISVMIGGIMEDHADICASPPSGEGGYVQLAESLASAGSDITILAQAMAVLARWAPRVRTSVSSEG